MAETLPLADPLDRVSEALLAYVRGSMMGTIPRVEVNFVRSPSDLPGTTPDNEWQIVLVIAAIEKLEDDGHPIFKYRQEFPAVGPSKEIAIAGVVERVRNYLREEIAIREAELAAARDALKCVDEMPVLDTIWSDQDPQEEGEAEPAEEPTQPESDEAFPDYS